jgi:hypothetical protein
MAISIDPKKKELVGEFKNAGREWHRAGQASKANIYDFPSMADGKTIPYGIYNIAETPASYRSGSTRTPRSSPSPRSRRGGSSSDQSATPTPAA